MRRAKKDDGGTREGERKNERKRRKKTKQADVANTEKEKDRGMEARREARIRR